MLALKHPDDLPSRLKILYATAPEDGGVAANGVAGGVSVKGHYRSGWLSRSQAGHEPVRPVTRTGVSSEGERTTGPTGPQ